MILVRGVYISVVAILFGLVTIQAIYCGMKLQSHPKYINTQVVTQNETEFPSITLCPIDPKDHRMFGEANLI
jgi:hypothetical protein